MQVGNPDKERRHGKCPLTPEEVGLILRALGFGSDVHIYVASGEVYGGEETLAPLKALFPNFHTKETIASMEELAPFSSFSARMAALDFMVCDESDVFVTNNNGNMARMLAGRRYYTISAGKCYWHLREQILHFKVVHHAFKPIYCFGRSHFSLVIELPLNLKHFSLSKLLIPIFFLLQEILWAQTNSTPECQETLSVIHEPKKYDVGRICFES